MKDPREVVKAGDIVKAKVMEVDVARQRIALSLRLDDTPGEKAQGGQRPVEKNAGRAIDKLRRDNDNQKPAGNTLAQLFAAAEKKKNGRL